MPQKAQKLPIRNLTADTTLDASYGGCLVTNRGAAGAVVITLPTATAALEGLYIDVYSCVNQDLTVATATTDTLCVDGDVSADSIAWVTSSHKVGNGARFVCIGAGTAGSVAGWICILHPAATTTTIATQTIVTA